jgi:hypothetical protein
MPPRSSFAAPLVLVGIFMATGCGSAIAEGMRTAKQSGDPPDELVVIYNDHGRRHGGDRIEIHGDGELHGDRWRPGDVEQEGRYWEGHVPPHSIQGLIDLIVELEAWEQKVEVEDGRLNDQRARLTIHIGSSSSTIWEYRSDLEGGGRIFRIKTHLDALSFEVRHPMADGATDGFGGDRGH